MDEAEIEAQVARHLANNLEIIAEADLAAALHSFVDKARPAQLPPRALPRAVPRMACQDMVVKDSC